MIIFTISPCLAFLLGSDASAFTYSRSARSTMNSLVNSDLISISTSVLPFQPCILHLGCLHQFLKPSLIQQEQAIELPLKVVWFLPSLKFLVRNVRIHGMYSIYRIAGYFRTRKFCTTTNKLISKFYFRDVELSTDAS